MRTCLLVPVLCLIPFLAAAQDSDNDGLSDALEAQLGMDPRHADAFELLCDDKSKAEGDKSIGRGLETAGDFTKLWFCVAAKDRYVWKIEFTQPWQRRSDVATILYVDADNHRDTGRKDKEFARGVDMMLRPDGAQMIEWPALVKTTSAAEGNVLYLVADIKLNQQDGKSVYRCWLLTQNTTKGRETDNDNMPAITVTAAGRTDRARPAISPGHALYYPPEAISNLAVRMMPDAPTAEVTWMTSWVCNAHVEFGLTKDMKERVQAPPAMQNHRAFLPVQFGQTYYVRVACTSAEGEPKTSEIVSFKAEKFIPKGSVQRAEIPLTLSAVVAAPAPFLVGVPFPRGALASVDNIRLLQDGNELPVQVECASRWPDGSVKWALVQFLTDGANLAKASSLRKVVSLEYGNAVRPTLSAPKPMAVDEGNRIVCTTGSLQAVIDKRSFRLFSELSDGRRQLIGKPPGGLYLIDATGKEYVSAQPDEVVIEENGPVRAVVKVRGHYTAQDGAKLFEYIVRLMFYRDQSAAGGFVRIFHTFGNDNVKQTLTDIRQMGIRVPLALTEAKPRLE
ncbi:MAG: hypothetical protein FJ279_24510, partial [Planctomycetes bacterium]|nr:hypothetical protein [Planctomycetota bacterium]